VLRLKRKGKVAIILGGQGKGQDFTALRESTKICQSCGTDW
jgi:UDP-N-acetylmuramoylalanine-D-glutamate ligase